MKHPDKNINVQDLFLAIKPLNPKINITTIYRNLDQLENEGIIMMHRLPDGEEKVYQYVIPKRDCSHHLHLYCKKCGAIIHLDCDFMDELKTHLLAEHGFLIDTQQSMIMGLCENCRRKEE